jgi:hypothetical protein
MAARASAPYSDTPKKLWSSAVSKYIEAHNQSDEMVQHSAPEIGPLKADIQQAEDLAMRQA